MRFEHFPLRIDGKYLKHRFREVDSDHFNSGITLHGGLLRR